MPKSYKIVAWNVDKYDNNVNKWLSKYLDENKPDVVFLSETKIKSMGLYFDDIQDYEYINNFHKPYNIHGVAMLIKSGISYKELDSDIDSPVRRDTHADNPSCGRIISVCINNKFNVVGTYVPNSGRNNDQIKIDYRINSWDPALYQYLDKCSKKKPTLWIGDINIAPKEIDVSNPTTMKRYAGFRPEERKSFEIYEKEGWIDVWRRDNPNKKKYTWLSYNRRPDYGMRLDNMIASKKLAKYVIETSIIDADYSDHIPVCCTIRI